MTISKETAQDLKNVVEMIKKIELDYKKCEPHYRTVEADLQEAIDDKSPDELELFLPQMEEALKHVDACVYSINGALALLGNLRKDADLMAVKTDQINTLVKSLVDKKQLLVAHAAKGRAMVLDDAQQALAAAKTSAETAESDLSELKNRHEQLKKAIDWIAEEARKLDDATVAAQRRGDARRMSAERVKYLELGYQDQEIGAQALLAKVKKALPKFQDGKQRAEAQWILDDLPGRIDACRALSKRGGELALLKVAAAAPPAPAAAPAKLTASQVATIARSFPIDATDSKEMSRLTKVLNDNPHGDWPAKLIKAFGWKKSDVDAGMKRVNQLPFVKPLYLIDV